MARTLKTCLASTGGPAPRLMRNQMPPPSETNQMPEKEKTQMPESEKIEMPEKEKNEMPESEKEMPESEKEMPESEKEMPESEKKEMPEKEKNKMPEKEKKYALKGGGGKVAKLLGTSRCPKKEHWKDDAWLAKLYNLPSQGIRLKDFRCYAFYVSGTQEPSELDLKVRRIEAAWPSGHRSDLADRWLQKSPYKSVDTTAFGVGSILGWTRPSKHNWASDEWLRALFLIGTLGVELSAFTLWGRAAAIKKEPQLTQIINPLEEKPRLRSLEGAESLVPVKKRRALALQAVESTPSSSSSDSTDNEVQSKRADSPAVVLLKRNRSGSMNSGAFLLTSETDIAEAVGAALDEEEERDSPKRNRSDIVDSEVY